MQNNQTLLTSNQEGQLPPQAIEVERAILGTFLIEPKSIDQVEVEVADFYSPNHEIIFSAMLTLKQSRKPIDTITVAQELNRTKHLNDAGGVLYLAELTDSVASSAHLEYHVAILKQKSLARKLILQSQNVIARAFDQSEDVQDIVEFLEKNFTDITTNSVSSEYHDMKESIEATLKYLADLQSKKDAGEEASIPTGLKGLDEQIGGGWSAPDLVILGGRPSMGKSALALKFARTAAKSNNHCLFISIEMTLVQLMMRIFTEDERVQFYNMKTGQMRQEEWGYIDEKIAEIQSDKLFIADDHNIRNLNNIKSLARNLHRKGQLKIMIIDYLQLIKTNLKFGTRDLEIGHITGELKNLAKELNIPIILLAQLNRGIKGQVEQVPVLSDLRESGNIEQDADKVIFPHRPTYYNPEAVDKDGRPWANRGVLVIAKNREGAKDEKVYFTHDDNFKKIYDDDEVFSSFTQANFTMPTDAPF